MAESPLFQRPIEGKRVVWGIVLMAYRPIIWLLDWLGRIELLYQHYGKVAVFIESPYLGAGALIGGLVLIASAIRSGLRQPPRDTLLRPPDTLVPVSGQQAVSGQQPETAGAAKFEYEGSDVEMTSTQTEGEGKQLSAKDSKVRIKDWRQKK